MPRDNIEKIFYGIPSCNDRINLCKSAREFRPLCLHPKHIELCRKELVWASLRSEDGRVLDIYSHNEFQSLWYEVTEKLRLDKYEWTLIRPLHQLSRFGRTDEFEIPEVGDIPDDVMNAFIHFAQTRRAYATLKTEQDARVALRSSRAGDVIQVTSPVNRRLVPRSSPIRDTHFNNPYNNRYPEYRIEDVVVNVEYVMVDTLRLHVLSTHSVLDYEYRQVIEIERLNYPHISDYKFTTNGVRNIDPHDPNFVWFVHEAQPVRQYVDWGEPDPYENNLRVLPFVYKPERVDGYALLDTSRPEFVYVEDVGVRPDAKGKGVGSALVQRFVRWFTECSDCPRLVLKVQRNNIVAVNLYRQHGFRMSRKNWGMLLLGGYGFMSLDRSNVESSA